MDSLQHTARIGVQGGGFWCEGDIVVPGPGGYKNRVHDVLNREEQFIALTDVTLRTRPQEAEVDPEYHEVLLLRKNEIKYVVPLD